MEPLEQVTSNESTQSIELGDYLFCSHCGSEQCKSMQCDFRQYPTPLLLPCYDWRWFRVCRADACGSAGAGEDNSFTGSFTPLPSLIPSASF